MMCLILSPILDPRRVLVVSALAMVILLAMAGFAAAVPCLSSDAAVKAAHPGAWSTWTLRVPSHKGEQCWMTREERKEVMQAGSPGKAARGTQRAHETRPVGATRAALPETVGLAPPAPPPLTFAERFEAMDAAVNLERALQGVAAAWRIAETLR